MSPNHVWSVDVKRQHHWKHNPREVRWRGGIRDLLQQLKHLSQIQLLHEGGTMKFILLNHYYFFFHTLWQTFQLEMCMRDTKNRMHTSLSQLSHSSLPLGLPLLLLSFSAQCLCSFFSSFLLSLSPWSSLWWMAGPVLAPKTCKETLHLPTAGPVFRLK